MYCLCSMKNVYLIHPDLDDLQPGRGVTLTDFNNDELIDIAYGNWNGPHKLFLQRKNHAGESSFYVSPLFMTGKFCKDLIHRYCP